MGRNVSGRGRRVLAKLDHLTTDTAGDHRACARSQLRGARGEWGLRTLLRHDQVKTEESSLILSPIFQIIFCGLKKVPLAFCSSSISSSSGVNQSSKRQ